MKKQQGGFVGIALLIIVGVVGMAALGSAMNLITIPWLRFDSKVNMERGIVTKTYNPDNALYNYHWFKERAGAIEAATSQIIIADNAVATFKKEAGDREKWTFEDKTESARLSAVAQGLRSQKESLVKEYNARMKEADRSIFAEELPLFFSL